MNQLKDSLRGDAFPDLELWANIWRGWIFPVGGTTPDRHRPDRLKVIGSKTTTATLPRFRKTSPVRYNPPHSIPTPPESSDENHPH